MQLSKTGHFVRCCTKLQIDLALLPLFLTFHGSQSLSVHSRPPPRYPPARDPGILPPPPARGSVRSPRVPSHPRRRRHPARSRLAFRHRRHPPPRRREILPDPPRHPP